MLDLVLASPVGEVLAVEKINEFSCVSRADGGQSEK